MSEYQGVWQRKFGWGGSSSSQPPMKAPLLTLYISYLFALDSSQRSYTYTCICIEVRRGSETLTDPILLWAKHNFLLSIFHVLRKYAANLFTIVYLGKW